MKRPLAALAVSGLVFATVSLPSGAQAANPEEPAEAHASVLAAGIGRAPIAGMAYSQASSETNPGPNRSGFNPYAAGAVIPIAGVNVPVSDFIEFGQAGAVYSESTATSPYTTRAISGTLSSDGSVHLDDSTGGFAPATIDLLALFKKAGISGLTDAVVSQADLKLAIGGAEVITENGTFLDQDGVGGIGQYRVAQADLDLTSPLVKGIAGQLYDAAGAMDQAAEDQVNKFIDTASIASKLPDGTTVTADVDSQFQEKVIGAILAKPITTKNKIITVDFSTGKLTIHLDQVLHGQETVDGPVFPAQDVRPGDPTGLNSQNPNTELIDDEIYPMVAESIHDLMNEVWSIALGVVDNSVDSITVDFTATRPDATATWSVNLGGTATPAECAPAGPSCDALVGGINAAVPAINQSLVPAREFLIGDAGDQLFRLAIDDLKTAAITIPLRKVAEPVLELLAKVFSVQVNHQTIKKCAQPDGTLAPESVEVNAVSVALLRPTNLATINLGNAGTRTDACAPAAEASIVDGTLLSGDVAAFGYSTATPVVNPGPNNAGVNGTLFGQEQINLGGVQVPLTDVLDFGELGALESESTATTPYDAKAVAGVAGSDGAVHLDTTDGDFAPATVDLLTLFKKAGISDLTNIGVDEAQLKLGIGGAEVEAVDGIILDPDGVGGPGRYRVAQADLEARSPLIDQAASQLYDALGVLDKTAEKQLNSLLDLTQLTTALPTGTTVKAKVNSDTRDQIFKSILAQPITTKNEIVTVDFSTGQLIVHLDKIMAGEHTVDGPVFPSQTVRPGDPSGLNNQHPNTEIIDDEIYPMVAESIHDLMDEVWTIVMREVENSLSAITVDLTAVSGNLLGNSATATWTVDLGGKTVKPVKCTPTGLLGGVLCTTLTLAVNTVAGPAVNTVLIPLRDFLLGDAAAKVFALAVDDLKTAAITIPVRKVAEPFLEQVARFVSVQVNHQRTGTYTTPEGTQLKSLRVSAVSIGFGREIDGGRIDIGNAAVHTPTN